jgi:hypothetical protein
MRSGLGSSLWRKAQSGLYLNSSRVKIPLVGLQQYAPLWHPELSGSPFTSKEPVGTSYNVIGATWGIQGRTFITDDYLTTSAFLPPDALTIIMAGLSFRTLPAIGTGWRVCGWCNAGATTFSSLYFYNLTGVYRMRWYVMSDAGNTAIWGATHTPTAGVKYNFALTQATPAALPLMYINGVDVGATQVTKTGTPTRTSDIFSIGRWGAYDGVGEYLDGMVGEVVIANRVYSPSEIKQVDSMTKWRYS